MLGSTTTTDRLPRRDIVDTQCTLSPPNTCCPARWVLAYGSIATGDVPPFKRRETCATYTDCLVNVRGPWGSDGRSNPRGRHHSER